MSTPAQPLTQQAQDFDPIAELRKRYPDPRVSGAPDAKIIDHLSSPDNFRAAFPEYAHVDDETITRNMARHAPNLPGGTPQLIDAVKAGKAPGAPTQATPFERGIPGTGINLQGSGGALWNFFKGIPAAAGEAIKGLFNQEDNIGKLPAPKGMAAKVQSEELTRRGEEDEARKQAGYSPAYRAAAQLPLPVDPASMERHAARGEGGAIIGEATGGALMTAAPEIIKPIARPISSALSKGASTLAKPITSMAKRVAEPYGIGVEGESMLKKGLSPYAKQLGYDKAVETATPDLVKYHSETPIKSVKDLHEALPAIQDKIMEEEVRPVARTHAKEELAPERMARVQKAVEDSVSPFTEEFDEGAAKDVKELAGKMGKTRTLGDVIGVEAKDKGGLLGYINSKLESYFQKYPSARKSDLMKNPDTAAWEMARRQLRTEAMDHLAEQGETNMGPARERWGALQELQRTTERRINQADRTKPMSLPRIMGAVGAPKTGGASMVAGEIAHHLNKADTLVRRGIEKMAKNSASKTIDVTPRAATPKALPAPEKPPLKTGPGGSPPAVPLKYRSEATGTGPADASALGPRGEGGTIGGRKLLPAPKPPAGMSQPSPIAKPSSSAAIPFIREEAKPLAKPYTPKEMEEAELLVRQTHDMMTSGDKPGRYYDENEKGDYNKNQSAERGVTAGGQWRGVKSMRTMLPWIKDTEFTPSQLDRGMREGGNLALRDKILNSAAAFIRREQEGTAFRAHDAGKYDIDVNAHAHATSSRMEAEQYAEHRNPDAPQAVSKIKLRNFAEGEHEVMDGPRGNKWHKFNRQLTKEDYEE